MLSQVDECLSGAIVKCLTARQCPVPRPFYCFPPVEMPQNTQHHIHDNSVGSVAPPAPFLMNADRKVDLWQSLSQQRGA